MNGPTSSNSVWSRPRIIVVVAVDTLQALQVLYYFHRMLIDKGVLGQLLRLLAEEVKIGGRQYVRKRSKAMEQHGRELYDQNQREEEHKHQTDRF